jgi:hypothetical protein
LERRASIRSNVRDGRETHDHNQRQHYGIFNGCGAVFRPQKSFRGNQETRHTIPPQLEVERPLINFSWKLMRTFNAKLRVTEFQQSTANFRGICELEIANS